jgi:putative isomerase
MEEKSMLAPELSPYLQLLKDRIDLVSIPFTERGSRLMVFRTGNAFSIRLAERWLKLSRHLTAYRDRPALVDQWIFTDEAGNPLELEIVTYPHLIEAGSRLGNFGLAFTDEETLFVKVPAGRVGMTFQVRMDRSRVDRRGGVLGLVGEIRRNIAYTSNAHLLRNEVVSSGQDLIQVKLLLESENDSGFLLNITPRLGFNRHVPPAGEVFERAHNKWNDWFAAAPPAPEAFRSQYYFAWWVMRAGLISPRFYITREAMAPSKVRYVGVWQWDAYFHALAYRHIDMKLARNQLRVFLDHQREDGMIPDAVHDEGIVTHLTYPVDSDVTKPPLGAWTTWKLHQFSPDLEFLNEVYEPLKRCVDWWCEKNDLDGNGLCEYLHPYSSGLDDSPLWDAGMPVESPDLNSYLYLEHEALGNMAGAIGLNEEAANWSQRADALVKRIVERSWDDQSGYFWAKRDGKKVDVRTPFNLYPLITGKLPAVIADRLVAHLTNPQEFWAPFPVPSVALDDPSYNPGVMWRGPTWVNVNYMLIEGLQRSGYLSTARELRHSTLEMLCKQNDIFEYYNPQTGEKPLEAASFFGWSAAILIDLVLQESALASGSGSGQQASADLVKD